MSKSSSAFFESLISDAARAGVYRLPKRHNDDLELGAGAAGCCVFHVDLARARSKDDMLDLIGRGLAFPEWFGHNWDALADCLLDMGWRPALGFVVVLKNAEMVRARAESDFATLLKIFADVADERRDDAVPFWCLVDIPHSDYPALLSLPAPPV